VFLQAVEIAELSVTANRTDDGMVALEAATPVDRCLHFLAVSLDQNNHSFHK
jgi:hypothetical protein